MTPLSRWRRGPRRTPRPPLPEVRQEATVTVGGTAPWPARVTRIAPTYIVLVLLLDVDEVVTPGTVATMTVDYATPRGLVRLTGRGRIEEPDVAVLELGDDAEVVQRRDYVRVPVVRPVKLAPVDEDGEVGPWIDTLTADISGNGFLAAGPDTLPVGTPVRFRLRLVEGEPPVEGAGRVARTSIDGRRGIAIEELAARERQRLVAFIFERQRIARKMTREMEQ